MIERYGWTLLFHECIVEQMQKLAAAVDRAKLQDPQGFDSNANVKLPCIVKVKEVHKKKSSRVCKSSTDGAGSPLNRIQILVPIGINAPGHPNRFAFDEARAGDGSCMRTWL